MSTTALISVEEYLRRTEKPNCEYENGVLLPKAMPTTLHALIQTMLLALLGKQNRIALSELTVHVAPTTYLVPDVTVVRKLEHPYPTEPALLCVEILSPSDRVGSTLAKCEKYHAWGVPDCWVIDPERRIAWEYPANGVPARIEENGTLRAGDISISLSELFTLPAAN